MRYESIDIMRELKELKTKIKNGDTSASDTSVIDHAEILISIFKNSRKDSNIEVDGDSCKTVISYFGDEAEMIVSIEEFSELTKEITKTLRERTFSHERMENVLEEMADVYICLEMLRQIYDFSIQEINTEIQKKQKRTNDRINRCVVNGRF